MAKHRAASAGSVACLLVLGFAGGCGSEPPSSPSAPLTVTSTYPPYGAVGDDIQVTGTGFQQGTTVTMGGVTATSTFITTRVIQVRVPDHPEGKVDVVVTNPGGQTARLGAAFEYPPAALAVTEMSPTAGLAGDAAKVLGRGFVAGMTVHVDGVAADVFARAGVSTSILMPAHSPGTVDVVVTNLNGQTATRTAAYTYLTVTLSVSATQVAPGGELTVSWVAPTGRVFSDWIGIFKESDPSENYTWYEYTNGATTGTLTTTAPSQPGQYEFRYLPRDGFVVAGRSSVVTVK